MIWERLHPWEIRAGDSITSKVNAALQNYDIFLLVWSAYAQKSPWVDAEVQAATTRLTGQPGTSRVVPLLLDATPRPPLLSALRYVDMRAGKGVLAAASEILGFDTQQAFIAAIQDVLHEELEVQIFHGYGPAVGCPSCGAGIHELEQFVSRDEQEGGVKCTRCKWSEINELQ